MGSAPRTPLAGPVLIPVLGGGGGTGRVLQSSVRWEEALVQLENYLSFHASLEFTEVTFLLIATWPYCFWCKMTLEKCFKPETSGCLAGGCQSLLRIPPLPACDSLPANEPGCCWKLLYRGLRGKGLSSLQLLLSLKSSVAYSCFSFFKNVAFGLCHVHLAV